MSAPSIPGTPRPPEPPGEASIERFFASQGEGAFPPEEEPEEPTTPEPEPEPTPEPPPAERGELVAAPDPFVGWIDARKAAPRSVSRHRIVRWARDVAGVTPWPRQAEALVTAADSTARTILLLWGRRSGKTLVTALLAVYQGTVNAKAHTAAVRPGERPVILLLANSREQAGNTADAIRSLLGQPRLAPFVESMTADLIKLTTGIDIWVAPASARTIRGRAVAFAVIDELGWALDGEGQLLSPQAADELLAAVRPSLAQFPQGRLVVSSTPRFRSGALWDMWQAARSELHPDVIAMHGPTWTINPTIPRDWFEAEYLKDPAMARREYGAEFDSGIGQVLPDDLLRSCVQPRGDIRPARGWRYLLSLDPAGASGDAFAATVGHLDHERTLVVDAVRLWQGTRGSPIDFRYVLDDIAALHRAYGVVAAASDQWAFEPIRASLAERGVRITPAAWTAEKKIEAVQLLRQRLHAGSIALPSEPPRLIAELAALEVNPTAAGKEQIAAPRGMHDDLAMSLLGLVLLAEQNKTGGRVINVPSSIWD